MRILIMCFFLLSCVFVYGQEIPTYEEIETKSYEQYLLNDFKSIKKTISEAEKNEIDFKYLRMRAGILAYDKGNYVYACDQFSKALKMNPSDTLAQEYLYFSLLFSDREDEARTFAIGLTEYMIHKLKVKENHLRKIEISSGYVMGNKDSKANELNYYSSKYRNTQGLIYNNSYKFNLNLKHSIGKRFYWYNGATYFKNQFTGDIRTQMDHFTTNYSNGYFQFNSVLGLQLNKGWSLYGAFGFYHTNTSWYTITPNFMTNKPNLSTIENVYNTTSFSLLLAKRWKYLHFGMQLSSSNFLEVNQKQMEFSTTLYPLGNSNLYLTSTFNYLQDSISRIVLNQKIGFKLSKRIFIDGEYGTGDFTNRISNGGFIVYNSLDKITEQYGINLHVFNKKRMEFVVSYYQQKSTGTVLQYLNLEQYEKVNYNYLNNNLIGTIRWKF